MLHALRVALVVCCGGILFACNAPAGPDASSVSVLATASAATASVDVDLEVDASNGTVATPSTSNRPSVFRHNIETRPLIIPDPVSDHVANGFLFAEIYSGIMRPSFDDDTLVELDLAVS